MPIFKSGCFYLKKQTNKQENPVVWKEMLQASNLDHLFYQLFLKICPWWSPFLSICEIALLRIFSPFHKGKSRDMENNICWKISQLQGRTKVISFKRKNNHQLPRPPQAKWLKRLPRSFGLKVIKCFNWLIQSL